MEKSYDLVIIGTGTAASTVAYKCRSTGWDVAVIDSRPFGGTCALRGCDPKKILVGAAELIDWNQRMMSNSVITRQPQLNWESLIRFKQDFVSPIPGKRKKRFAKAGIDTYAGQAHFVNKTTIQVNDDLLTGRYVLIASGSRPATLDIPGKNYLTFSDQFLDLEHLPKKIIFVGGGYISLEFAHISIRAGSSVDIVHRGSRILKQFDPGLVEKLTEATSETGINLYLDSNVSAIEKKDNILVLHALKDGKEMSIEADLIIHGAGRVAEIDSLNLESANIDWTIKGVTVNKHLQSPTNPAVYAAGDSSHTKGMHLTPIATVEGHVVSSNLLKGNHRTADYSASPSVVFTIPALAAVGMSEQEAIDKGLKFNIKMQDTSGWFSSRRVGEKYSGFKTLVEKETDRILGAHLLGSYAGEIINLFALAMRYNIPASKVRVLKYEDRYDLHQ